MPAAATDVDVLVVGGGPTGLLLSNLLGSMGVDAMLVEKESSTVQEPRAVSIDDESMRAIQAVDLEDEIAAITVKGYGSVYRGPDGSVFSMVKPFVKEYGFDKRNAFEQPVFEGKLREALSRYPSVDARFQTEFISFEQDEDGVTAYLRRDDGAEYAVRARYMVACDGGRSNIRKLLGISLVGSSFTEPWLIIDLKTTRNRCFHTEVYCDPRRSAITLPGPGGIRRYEFKLNPGETAEEAEKESFARELLAQAGEGEHEEIRRQRVYTFHARTAERWRSGRVFLAGDAAHLTPPFAGQGMNSGLRDAHNLAWKLAEALRMKDPEELLSSYETERRPHAWSMIELALNMGRVMMPSTVIAGVMIRAGFRLLGLYKPAKDYFAQMRYKPKPRFKGGLIRPDMLEGKRSAVGQMIPQPVVVTMDRKEALLDKVLPDRPVVLVFSERPDEAITQSDMQRLTDAGACVVGLTPEWTNPVAAAFPIVRDQSRFFSNAPFSNYLEKALLVRRDRYVAASEPLNNILGLLPVIARLTAGPGKPAEGKREEPQAAAS